jgi:hypothetical protein
MQQVVNFAEAFRIVKGNYPTLADYSSTSTQENMWEIIDEAIAIATPEQIKLLDIRYN